MVFLFLVIPIYNRFSLYNRRENNEGATVLAECFIFQLDKLKAFLSEGLPSGSVMRWGFFIS